MSDLRFPRWQRPYEEAMMELDSSKLAQRISDAETAIVARLGALVNNPDGEIERQAIEGALEALRILQKDKVNDPGSTRAKTPL